MMRVEEVALELELDTTMEGIDLTITEVKAKGALQEGSKEAGLDHYLFRRGTKCQVVGQRGNRYSLGICHLV